MGDDEPSLGVVSPMEKSAESFRRKQHPHGMIVSKLWVGGGADSQKNRLNETVVSQSEAKFRNILSQLDCKGYFIESLPFGSAKGALFKSG